MISPAQGQDLADVIDLLVAQMAEHDIDIPRAGVEAAVRGMLGDPRRGTILVHRDEGRVTGLAFVSFTWSLEHGGLTSWLEELYVLPALRERGIGTQLLAAAMDAARAAGCAAVDLEVDVEHRRAARLYERHGFRALPRSRWVRKLQPSW
jgi:GNAT superfamily N-acetyltransferase